MWTLDKSLGFTVSRTARSIKRALDAKLAEYNLTASQYVVMSRLFEEEGIKHNELGVRLNMDNPTITGIVDRMERDGLLQRRRDKSDRRVVRLYLTDVGKELIQEIEHFARETDEEAWSGISATQRKETLKNLDIIWKNLNGKQS